MLFTLLTSDRFFVSRFDVRGTDLVDREEILTAVGQMNMNVFRLGSDAVKARLEHEIGALFQVSVHTRLPNRASITCVERERPLIWESGGRLWWVGVDGRVLGRAREPRDLIVVHDLESWLPDLGEHVVGVPWGLARELGQLLPHVSAFDYTRHQGLIIHATAAQRPVYLGHHGDPQQKVAILRALSERLESEGTDVEYIDLRDERVANLKLR